MAVRRGSKDKPVRIAAHSEQAAPPAAVQEISPSAAGEEATVDDFGLLAVTMSWLLTEFNEVKPLRDAGLGLGDWAVLAMLVHSGGMTKKLSQNLGIPVTRVASIVDSLARDGLASVEPSPEGSKGKSVIKITDAGRAKLEAVNAELTLALDAVLKSPALRGALKQVTLLGRLLPAATVETA